MAGPTFYVLYLYQLCCITLSLMFVLALKVFVQIRLKTFPRNRTHRGMLLAEKDGLFFGRKSGAWKHISFHFVTVFARFFKRCSSTRLDLCGHQQTNPPRNLKKQQASISLSKPGYFQ